MLKTNFKCEVGGCIRDAHSRQMCVPHYRRWKRHGSPLAGRAMIGEKKAWLTSILVTSSNDCVLSPFQTDASRYYWSFNEDGVQILAHRWVCEQVHGPAPSDLHHAAHACGQGHLGCVSPHHLSWATPIENNADKRSHGTQAFGEALHNAKLTETAIRQIREMAPTMTRKAIANVFGVSRHTISAVVNGKTWTHVATK